MCIGSSAFELHIFYLSFMYMNLSRTVDNIGFIIVYVCLTCFSRCNAKKDCPTHRCLVTVSPLSKVFLRHFNGKKCQEKSVD